MTGSLLREINNTTITLIPKVSNPSGMRDHRPITCNTLYMIISKLTANRMKSILHELIDLNQASIVPARSIGDNVLLAQEIMRNYNRDDGCPRCAIKVDLRKTYDTLDWEFLILVLRQCNFPELMIGWISPCISAPKFYVSINGELNGFFS